ARRLPHRRRRRGAAHLLRRSAALRGGALRGAGGDADRATVGIVRLPRGARPRMSAPRASGYFRTRYDADFALLDTRTQKAAFGIFLLAALALPFTASPYLLDLANQVLLAVIGAV